MPGSGAPRRRCRRGSAAIAATALCAAVAVLPACSDLIVYVLVPLGDAATAPPDAGDAVPDAGDTVPDVGDTVPDAAPFTCPAPELVGYASVATPNGDGGVTPATTGGEGGDVVPAYLESDIEAYGKAPGPLIIQIQGMITVNGQADITVGGKTIEGSGPGSGLMGGGLRIKATSNVIVRNLTVLNAYGTDAVTLETADHVWVDHCDFSSQPVSSTDTFDDLIDITRGSDYVTVSWTNLHDHNHDISVIGNSDAAGPDDIGKLHVTFHHNLFSNTLSQNPSLRFGRLHAYSNHYVKIFDIGIVTRLDGVALVEQNVFDSVGVPLTTHFPNSTTSDGYIKDVGNTFPNSGLSNVGQSMDLIVPYRYTFTSAADVPAVVDHCVGPRYP